MMLRLALIFIACSTPFCCAMQINSSNFSVVAYLPEWRFHSANFDSICSVVTHLIFFSVEPDASGDIVGMDRFPSWEVLRDARLAADKHGCKLLLCFGGNGRSAGFSKMTRNGKARKRFVRKTRELLSQYNFDGVDYNWEYPGYAFGGGYKELSEVEKDYRGLALLVELTRKILGDNRMITMSYYPDSRQEQEIIHARIPQHIDLMHMMSYDQTDGPHSTYVFGTKSVDQALSLGLAPNQVTMGVPFYGRVLNSGEWITYEDLVQRHAPLATDVDTVYQPGDGARIQQHSKKNKGVPPKEIAFNGIDTMEKKVRYSMDKKIGGVMIWEVGQDCRTAPVTRAGQTHGITCPNGADSSLLTAIQRVMQSVPPQIAEAEEDTEL